MPRVTALHTVCCNPTGRLASTGEVDDEGAFITRAVVTTHHAGDSFTIDDAAELRAMIEAGAVMLSSDLNPAL